MSTQPIVAPSKTDDFMPLHGIDHVEFYVGNALQAASFWVRALGFKEMAYAGLETGVRDRASHVLEQGRIRIVLTGALTPGHEIGAHVARHGDGVKVIALGVPDVDHAYQEATTRGATGVEAPHDVADDHGTVRRASIKTYGDTLHTFVDRSGYKGPFLPGYAPRDEQSGDTGLLAIDHIVGNVELGHMDEWVKYYEDVFGMREMLHFSDEDISTEYSALMSKVVTSGNGRVKFPLNEPAEGKRKSQIDEYLEYYGGAGAQHIAVATRDIVRTVAELQRARDPVPAHARDLLRRRPRADRRDRRGPRGPQAARHPRRPRRRGLPAADLHQADRRPPDGLPRGDRAPRRARLRRRQLQGAVRGDRARAGPAREPLGRTSPHGPWARAAGAHRGRHRSVAVRPRASPGRDPRRRDGRHARRAGADRPRPGPRRHRQRASGLARRRLRPRAEAHARLRPARPRPRQRVVEREDARDDPSDRRRLLRGRGLRAHRRRVPGREVGIAVRVHPAGAVRRRRRRADDVRRGRLLARRRRGPAAVPRERPALRRDDGRMARAASGARATATSSCRASRRPAAWSWPSR